MKNKAFQSIGTTVIVLNKDEQVLLGKRKDSYKSGCYGTPGGRIDRGEKLMEAAKRELFEETSLVAEEIVYVGVVKEWQEDTQSDFIHFVYLCTSWSGTVNLNEPNKCEGWEWFSLNTLPGTILPGHLAGLDIMRNKSEITMKDI